MRTSHWSIERCIRNHRLSWGHVRAAVRSRSDAPCPVLEHVGCAPLAGDRDVVPEGPPEVVGEKLWAAVDLPLAEHVEAIVVEQENSARAAARARAHRAHINRVGSAMGRVRPAIAGASRQFLGFDYLDDLRL